MKTASKQSLLRFVLVCLLAMILPDTSRVLAQTTTPTGNSTIRGRAVYRDTGRPIRRAKVLLLSDEGMSESHSSVTDNQGEFTFRNVPAGNYQVVVGKPGNYFDYPRPDKGHKPMEVSVDGTSSLEVLVRGEHGGAITGKITYPDGEPVVGAQVNIYFKQEERWAQSGAALHGGRTDDRGIYRVYSLPPGEYAVSAIEESLIIEKREGGSTQTVGDKSLKPYFYGDASTLKSARVIQVDAGRETTDINITLAERATYKVTGMIVAGGKPLPGAHLRLTARDDSLSSQSQGGDQGVPARADKDGRWVFPDIPDGEYYVEPDRSSDQFQESQDGGNKSRLRFSWQRLTVTVAGADVSDLMMSLLLSGRISGTVTVDDNNPLPRSVQVHAGSLRDESAEYRVGTSLEPSSKGVFLIDGVIAGENILTARVLDEEYYVKSLTWNSQDLLWQPIKIREGEEVTNVRIVLSAEVGRLSGRIILAGDKKPLALQMCIVIPAEEVRWNRFDSFLLLRTDKQGAFKLIGPPGEYLLLPPPRERQISPLDYIRNAAPKGMRVTLRPGNPAPVELVVTPPQ